MQKISNFFPYFIFLTFLFSSNISFSQIDRLPRLGLSDKDSIDFCAYFLKGDSLLIHEGYEQAMITYEQAESLVKNKGNDSLSILLKAAKAHVDGNLSVQKEDLKSARKAFEQAEAGHLQLARFEKLTLSRLDQALISYFENNLEAMEEGLNKAAQSVKKLPLNHDYRPPILYLRSVLYNQLGDYDQAIEVAKEEVKLKLSQEDIDTFGLANSYSSLGAYYDNKGDYDRAINYYQASSQLLNGKTGAAVTNNFNNISVSFSRKGQYDQALFFNKQQLSELDNMKGTAKVDIRLRKAFVNRGGFFMRTNEFDSAYFYLSKALDLDQKLSKPESRIYNNLGVLFRNTGKYRQAIDYTQQAIELNINKFGKSHSRVAFNYRNLGKIYDLQGDFQEALTYYQKALTILVPAFEDTSFSANPTLKDYSSPVDLLKTLRDKGKALTQLATRNQDQQSLKSALLTLQLATELVDSLRNEYQEDSQKFWNEEVRPIYEAALEVALKLYQKDESSTYLDMAFRFVEKSKATMLAAALQESVARYEAGIPDSLIQKEKSIKLDIAFYKERIFREKQKGEKANKDKILLWQGKILDQNHAYEALLLDLETGFPTYYQLKYQEQVATIASVQSSLTQEEALVEYFMGDEQIFIFYITPTEAAFTASEDVQGLERNLFALLEQMRDRDLVFEQGLSPELFSKYTNLAYQLYQPLLQSVMKVPVSSLVIIADGPLGYLPFELLLTREIGHPIEKVDYAGLPYLLKESCIRYEYSATLLLKPLTDRKSKGNLLGFAPVYQESGLTSSRDVEMDCEDARDMTFGNLSKNQEEVEHISELWQGQAFLASDATEAMFKAEASDHSILHLAMHGFINQCNPLYSGLVFSKEKPVGKKVLSAQTSFDQLGKGEEALNDGYLHAYEIYNMQLNADLAVLSACNTGFGKLARGEGIMSLARAFKYAGCPNIVTSLWQADDASTSKVMQDFYTLLKAGENKDEALRQAKLNFLATSRRNHPFFWGTFILIGDDSPVSRTRFSGMLVLFGCLGLLLVGLGYFGWRRFR